MSWTARRRREYLEWGKQLSTLRKDLVEGIVACLDEAGYPGTVINPDGTTTITLADEQSEGYNSGSDRCFKEAP